MQGRKNMIYKYNDGLHNAGRTPRLYLVKGRECKKFEGAEIYDFCVILKSEYEKCGKWSNTTYELELAAGVKPFYFISPMHGIWGQDYRSWGELIEDLQIPISVAKEIVHNEFMVTFERLEKIEEFQAKAEEENASTETVIISFGNATRRQRDEGYFENEKTGHTSTGIEVVIKPGKENDWYEPEILKPAGAKFIQTIRTPGTGGGYYDVEILVPIK